MKIIVSGAGNVGTSIVNYLTLGNNDIVVIDDDAASLNALAKEFDVQPVLGQASHPDILEKAGAAEADMIIAATGNDEVNMLTCQIASILFNIPKKIARIDSQDYLNPLWGDLYNDKHIPIDLIISPAVSIAKKIRSLLTYPGLSDVTPLINNSVCMLAFRCSQGSPLYNNSVLQMERLIPDVRLNVFCIIHNNCSFVPNADYRLQSGDLVYFIAPQEDVDTIILNFAMEKGIAEKVLIFGGNRISSYLAAQLEQDDNILSCRIITEKKEAARTLSKQLNHTAVINGEIMNEGILEEAGIDNTDIVVAVTDQDKDTLLALLLSAKHNIPLSISVVNSSAYNSLFEGISDGIIVDRAAVTISSILQELRRTNIRDAYSLGSGLGEVWEVVINERNNCCGQKVKDIELPSGCKICVLSRSGEIVFPAQDTVLQAHDTIIVYVGAKSIKKTEKLFA